MRCNGQCDHICFLLLERKLCRVDYGCRNGAADVLVKSPFESAECGIAVRQRKTDPTDSPPTSIFPRDDENEARLVNAQRPPLRFSWTYCGALLQTRARPLLVCSVQNSQARSRACFHARSHEIPRARLNCGHAYQSGAQEATGRRQKVRGGRRAPRRGIWDSSYAKQPGPAARASTRRARVRQRAEGVHVELTYTAAPLFAAALARSVSFRNAPASLHTGSHSRQSQRWGYHFYTIGILECDSTLCDAMQSPIIHLAIQSSMRAHSCQNLPNALLLRCC